MTSMVALWSFLQVESVLEMADPLAVGRRIGERWQWLFQYGSTVATDPAAGWATARG